MKKNDAQLGMQVVANDLPDATVYEIDCIEGFEAHVVYVTRMGAVSAGWIDISLLREAKQIA